MERNIRRATKIEFQRDIMNREEGFTLRSWKPLIQTLREQKI